MRASAAKTARQRFRPFTDEEGRARFDKAARRSLDMSGEEFLNKWDGGEFEPLIDDPKYHEKIIGMMMLLPLVRKVCIGDDGQIVH